MTLDQPYQLRYEIFYWSIKGLEGKVIFLGSFWHTIPSFTVKKKNDIYPRILEIKFQRDIKVQIKHYLILYLPYTAS